MLKFMVDPTRDADDSKKMMTKKGRKMGKVIRMYSTKTCIWITVTDHWECDLEAASIHLLHFAFALPSNTDRRYSQQLSLLRS